MAKRSKYSGLQSVAYNERKGGGFWRNVLNFLLIVLSIGSALTLTMALLAPYISPESSTLFSIVALAVPYNFVFCLLLFMMWVARWRSCALVLLIPVAWGMFYVGRFVQVDFVIDREVGGKNDLKVLSYNTHSLGRMSSNSPKDFEAMLDSIAGVGAEIICLQEYNLNDSLELRIFDSILCDYPFKAYSIDTICKDLCQKHRGFLTLSKHKILDSKYFSLSNGVNTGFMCSDVLYGRDTLSIVNCHLQTTGISELRKNGGMREMVSDSGVMDVGGKIFDRLDANFAKRASQAEMLRGVVDSVGQKVIVVGDFNSIPMSYSYNTVMGDNLCDAFVEGGVGYGYTYRQLLGVLRIDYIMYDSEEWRCVEYESPEWEYSDHNPVFVTLKKK